MREIIASINPHWCGLIGTGKKRYEVRKGVPKGDVPFKVLMYCTKERFRHRLHTYINTGYGRQQFGAIGYWRSGAPIEKVNAHLPAYAYDALLAEGKVIGEFICDKVLTFPYVEDMPTGRALLNMPEDEDLPIETTPMYLIEAGILEETCLLYRALEVYGGKKTLYGWHISDMTIYDRPKDLSEFGLSRPPQSWCNVPANNNNNK